MDLAMLVKSKLAIFARKKLYALNKYISFKSFQIHIYIQRMVKTCCHVENLSFPKIEKMFYTIQKYGDIELRGLTRNNHRKREREGRKQQIPCHQTK